jgi:hypothetical protein
MTTKTLVRFGMGAALAVGLGAGGTAHAFEPSPARGSRHVAIVLERTTAPSQALAAGMAPRRGARVILSLPLSHAWRLRTGLGLDVQDAPLAFERERAVRATTGLEFHF